MGDYYIYKHTFPNGKIYIGITQQQPEKRWQRGIGYLNKNKEGKYHQQYMARAVIKYDWDDIKHEILFSGLIKEEAEIKEQELIAFYKSDNREFGYNLEKGGRVHRVSNETKEKMSKSRKGKPHTEEWNKKISKSNKGKISPFKGKHRSEETKKKISESTKGKVKTGKKSTKPVICVETGIIYESAAEVERQLNIRHENIARACKNNWTAGGYHWRYYIAENVAA